MAGVYRVLKPSGTFWLAIGDEYAAELKLIAQDDVGFACRSWVIWYYTFGVHCTRKFSRSHTHLLYFVKDPKHFIFNDEIVRVISDRQKKYRDKRANPAGKMPDDVWNEYPRICGTFAERTGFPCQMPESLLARIVRVSSNEGDWVLDPFCGSGTIPIEAACIGRNMAPGLNREFTFESWPNFPAELTRSLRQDAQAAILEPLEERLIGTSAP